MIVSLIGKCFAWFARTIIILSLLAALYLNSNTPQTDATQTATTQTTATQTQTDNEITATQTNSDSENDAQNKSALDIALKKCPALNFVLDNSIPLPSYAISTLLALETEQRGDPNVQRNINYICTIAHVRESIIKRIMQDTGESAQAAIVTEQQLDNMQNLGN